MMSEVMEKTFSSVSGFIMNSLGSRNMDVSPGFHNLIRSIRRARSKTEEEKVIRKELDLLKLKLQQPDTSVAKIKEYLVRIMYCEVLGHSAGFSYIHAIKLAQQGSLATKRVGYLAISLFLHENHELILLLVNTIQRDLSSSNMLHNCMALAAVCKLIGSEMVPAVLPLVEDKLKHSKALVRKKAVLALRSLYSKAPHMLQNPDALFKQALCDRDEAVTNAALHIHSDLIKENPAAHKQLVRPLVAVLRQVVGHKLSSDFEYHGISAPWTQIRILKMLARLGAGDEYYSSLMYDLLDDIIQQTSALSHNIAYAVQYECLITIATIHPQEQLLTKAAQCISKFLKSSNYNLKYMGICALSAVLKVFPSCADEHQLTVIDCLDDADDTIRFKTLDLLFQMTSSVNVQAICDRLLTHLEGTRDAFIRRDLLTKIIRLAEEHRPSIHWYLDTMTQVLLIGGSLVPSSVVNQIISAIRKDSLSGGDVAQHALGLYLPHISETKATSNQLIQISAWVLGEFAHSSCAPPASELLISLCSLLKKRLDEDTRVWVMAALTKVVASCSVVSDDVLKAVEAGKRGSSAELRQRACELELLCTDMELMKDVYTRPSSFQDLQFDWTLSFLDEYVSDALAQGAVPYKPKQQRHAERQQETHDIKPLLSGLNFVPYQSPTPSLSSHLTGATSISTPEGPLPVKSSSSPTPSLSSGASGKSSEPKTSESSTGLKLDGVKRVWGQKGYSKMTPTTRCNSQPQAVDSRVPDSPTITPSSPARGPQPSVQLSTATAVGRTTTSHDPSPDFPTKEECKKKELAKALFGGLHKTMTTSSKKPVDRKHVVNTKSSVTSPSTGQLEDEKSRSTSADLLLLSDLGGQLSNSSSLGVQFEEKVLDAQLPEETGGQNLNRHLASGEDRKVKSHGKTEQLLEADIIDEAGGGQRQEDDTWTSDPGRPKVDPSGKPHSSQPRSMYDEFKETAPEGQSSQTRTDLTGSESHIDQTLAKQDSPKRHGHDVIDKDQTPVEAEQNHLLDLQDSSALSDNSSQKLEEGSPELAATHPEETRTSGTQVDPTSTTVSPFANSTTEVHILDSSPYDVPPRNQNLVPEGWQSFARCTNDINLCSDAFIGATVTRVWKPDALGLVFHITNNSPKDAVTELLMKLSISSNLKVSDNPGSSCLSVDSIDPNATQILWAEVSCTSPAPSMSLGGEIVYRDPTKTTKRLFFNSPLHISDLLRPLELQTAAFGELWPKHTSDCIQSLEVDDPVSMSKVMTLLTQELNLHLVEIIGNEGIACGSLLSGPTCLLHIKVPDKKSLEIWVRSSSQLLSDTVAKQCRDDILKRL